MNFLQIKMMTFDVVGTLIDFERGILDFFADIGCKRTEQDVLTVFGKSEAHQQIETPNLPFTQMLVPIYDRMAQPLELKAGQGDGLRRSIEHWPAFSDSVDALRRLHRNFRLVALTNADNWALAHMASTLGHPFDDSVTCEDVGVNKPDPQVFAYCRGRQSVHGIDLNSTLHVAQSQYHDIGVSMKLGYATCWIERRNKQSGFGATPEVEIVTEPDLHFSSLVELADHVDKHVHC